jgi:hypothetical protein
MRLALPGAGPIGQHHGRLIAAGPDVEAVVAVARSRVEQHPVRLAEVR